jgi:hypothetical protein
MHLSMDDKILPLESDRQPVKNSKPALVKKKRMKELECSQRSISVLESCQSEIPNT